MRPGHLASLLVALACACTSPPTPPDVVPELATPAPEAEPLAPKPSGSLVAVKLPPPRASEFVDDEALTLSVAARIKTGVQPKSVAVSPDGAQLWVCNFGYAGRKNVYVYDATSLEQIGTIEFPGNAVEVAFTHDGSRAYVSNFGRGVVEVIDARRFELLGEIAEVGVHPKVIAVAPDDDHFYVANWSSSDVAVVDVRTDEVIERYATGKRPRGMAVGPDGTLFVNAMYDHRVHVFGPERAAEIATCRYPRHAVIAPTDGALFLTCSGDDSLRWHDSRDGRMLGEVEVGDNPRSFGLSDDGRWSAVANFDASSVTLVDLFEGRRHTTPVPGSDRIVGLAVGRGETLRVFVTSWGNNQLIELRLPEPSVAKDPGSDKAASPAAAEIRRN